MGQSWGGLLVSDPKNCHCCSTLNILMKALARRCTVQTFVMRNPLIASSVEHLIVESFALRMSIFFTSSWTRLRKTATHVKLMSKSKSMYQFI